MLQTIVHNLYSVSDILWKILLGINIVAFLAYGTDKLKAKRGAWRIPEKTLLLSAFFGGIGAWLGMRLFHHKTKYLQFRLLVPLFAVLQILFIGGCIYGFYRYHFL